MVDVEQRIEELEQLVRYHADLYFNESAPEITDAEFDALVDELRALAPDSAALQEVGAVPSYGRKLTHERPMGSLEKAKTNDDVRKWALENSSQPGDDTEVAVMPKMDGIACRLNYEKGRLMEAATRGNGDVGQDVTDNVRAMQAIPNNVSPKFTGEVRGEAFMPKSVFENLNEERRRKGEKPFKNPRNAASGSLTCEDPKVTASRNLGFRFYDILDDEMEFETEQEKRAYGVVELKGMEAVDMQVIDLIHFEALAVDMESKRPSMDYEIDGIVLALNSIADQEAAGFTPNGKNPKGKVAYKFKPEQKTAPVRAIDEQVGRTGRLTPVCRIEPTYIAGSTVSNLTLHNYGRVKELNIDVGDEILFEKAGDIIPQVVRVIDRHGRPETFHLPPEICPSCGGPVRIDEKEINLWCDNPACPAKLDRRILHWLRTLDVLGVGPETVIALCDKGYVKDISDLYFLTHVQVKEITGGERAAEKVITAILEKNEVPLWQFICALGIPNVGPTTSKEIAKRYQKLDNIAGRINEIEEDTLIASFTELDGVGPTIAKSIADGLRSLKPTIDKLTDCIDVIDVQFKDGPLVGKTFCITGSLPSGKKKAELGKEIEDAGGEMKTSVSAGLTYLIMADPESTSGKAQKARKLGTECVTEEQVMEMIG